MSELCALELAAWEDKRLQRYLKEATLPPGKQGDNLLLFGASSIGYGLIEAGIRVQFVAATALVQSLQRAK